jgi:hypothetical protein
MHVRLSVRSVSAVRLRYISCHVAYEGRVLFVGYELLRMSLADRAYLEEYRGTTARDQSQHDVAVTEGWASPTLGPPVVQSEVAPPCHLLK